MASAKPENLLLRCGTRTLSRHGVWAVYGSRRGLVEVPYTVARADAVPCAMYWDRGGLLRVAAANVLREDDWGFYYEQGLVDAAGNPLHATRFEQARTNVVLHNRDLRITHQLGVSGGAGTFLDGETVNASGGGSGIYVLANSTSALFALRGGSGTMTGTLTGATSGATRTIGSSALVWVATNVTVAKDQVGGDGAANAASKLTASAGNGTVLQAITLGSSARFQTVLVKRVTGSGTIQMTMDNGSTWTNIAVGTTLARVSIPTQTLANPTVGFRIVTSGDAIAIDFVQNENGVYQTNPMPTTTAAAIRQADSVTLSHNFGLVDFTAVAQIARAFWADLGGSIVDFPGILDLGNGTVLNCRLYCDNATRTFQGDIQTGGTNSFANRNIPAGAELAAVTQFKNLSGPPPALVGGQVAVDVGAGPSAFGAQATAFASFGVQTLRVGSVTGGGPNTLNGGLLDLKFLRGLFSYAEGVAVP